MHIKRSPFKIHFIIGFLSRLVLSIFPSPEQNAGLSNYQGSLNTGGSLPDLSNLHFPSPLPTPLDPDDGHHGGGGYHPNLSGGSSTGNLPAAMMHLGIGNHQGGWTEGGVCLGCVGVDFSQFIFPLIFSSKLIG
jgi:hypothetical protein